MSKDYMKSGEIREGDTLHFDGIGYYTGSDPNHFKVNKWMRKQGFDWQLTQGNPFNGVWVDTDGDHDPIEQDEAAQLYTARPRLAQRLIQTLRRR